MSSPPSIRSKILRIVAIPVLSLIALWVFIGYLVISPIAGISQTQGRWEVIGAPIRDLIIELQKERQLSAEAAGATAQSLPLSQQRRVTNQMVDRVRQTISSAEGYEEENAPAELRLLQSAMDGLVPARASADNDSMSAIQVTEAYTAFISAANKQFGDSTQLADLSSFRIVRGLGAYMATAEQLSRERAVLASVLKRGRMTSAEQVAFVSAVTSRRNFLVSAEQDMSPQLRANYQQVAGDLVHQRFQAAENKIFAWDLRGKPPLDAAEWKRDSEAVMATVNQQTQQEVARATAEGDDLKGAAFRRVGVTLGMGLLAIIISIVASYRFGRSMIVELRRLRDTAVELAEERLPKLVERLRKGEDVDPATEAPELKRADTAEVDRVVQAFSTVRRTAMEAAIGQATLRKGVGQVFLNLARRNQALLHRQLTLLDTMERRVEEPEILEDLFKIDHLTTRMRRHAENLIILSEATPARRWRDPVPIFDVVRSAALEVEDYTRVTVLPMPQAPLLVGGAVTDLIHLIAELVENATVFSPPNTVVHVRGMVAANGFALEVEDRGLGLNQATLDELNAKLTGPTEFDLADSDRLGLFVVARLAARHGIKVVLRPSPYDGTTAIVLLPQSMLATCESLTAGGFPPPVRQMVSQVGEPVRALEAVPKALSGAGSRPVARVPESSSGRFPAQQRREAPTPVRRAVPVPDIDDELDGLPVRVRQSHLAPQLRQAPSAARREVPGRTPEELSNLMSSMQQGWQQGRSRAEQEQDVWKRKDGDSDV